MFCKCTRAAQLDVFLFFFQANTKIFVSIWEIVAYTQGVHIVNVSFKSTSFKVLSSITCHILIYKNVNHHTAYSVV